MVELKKKVTLRTKTTEANEEVQKPQVALKKKQPEPTPVPPTPPIQDGGDEPKGKWKKYAAILAGLAVLGGGGYYLSQQGDDAGLQTVAEVVEGQKTDAAAVDENIANQVETNQEGDAPVADAATEAPAGEVRAVSADSHVSPAASTAAPSVPEPQQEKVVDITSTPIGSSISGTIEEEAIKVIRGNYGNGDVRKRNLGRRYSEIQNKVNEMYRNGLIN